MVFNGAVERRNSMTSVARRIQEEWQWCECQVFIPNVLAQKIPNEYLGLLANTNHTDCESFLSQPWLFKPIFWDPDGFGLCLSLSLVLLMPFGS